MNIGHLTQLGVGGLFAVVILIIVLKFLKTKNVSNNPSNKHINGVVETHIKPTHENVKSIHSILSEKDSEGVLKVYRRPSFDLAMVQIAETNGKIAQILENQVLEQKKMNKDVQDNKLVLERIDKTLEKIK